VSIWNRRAAWLLAPAFLLGSCGYHVAGKADLVPKDVHTIAVPAFSNSTVHYKLTDGLPQAIGREFITRTRYRIVNNLDDADAVLRGSVINYVVFPTLFDQATGRTSGLQVNVTMQVTLTDRTTGKVIFTRPRFEAHERYEVSVTNTSQYFDESGAAMQRLSRDVARDVVSAILENF